MLAHTLADLIGCTPVCEVMALLGVPARTLRRWRASGRAPQWAIDRLFQWRYGAPITAPGWEGFQFREGTLWTPEGVAVTPSQVRALPYTQALNRELQRKVSQPQQFRLL